MKNKPFKIIISPDGTITSVYSDTMNLQRIGSPTIHRATEVRFNNICKYWEVIGIPPCFVYPVLLQAGFINRGDAIKWEIQDLNKHLGEIIEAYSNGGYTPRKAENIRCEDAPAQEKVV